MCVVATREDLETIGAKKSIRAERRPRQILSGKAGLRGTRYGGVRKETSEKTSFLGNFSRVVATANRTRLAYIKLWFRASLCVQKK
jgi:hypothetical protein